MAGLIVALDDDDLVAAEGLARSLKGAVDAFKVGLTLFAAHGPEALFEVGQHGRVFCDLKLHDIPTQVRGAAHSLASKGVWLTTVHASGGRAMVAAAVEGAAAAGSSGSGTLVAAVTVLTSLDASELASVGFGSDPAAQVLRLASLAVSAGAQALVCSPQEVAAVRAEVGPGVLLVTPGVRPAGGDVGDQSRVATPAAAVAAGADYLVVGRPITASLDPRAAAEAIRAEMGA
ncbi:MAG: orotidine-5-phosphate decarboxylase [Actinomycetota bacterium]|jgi:orotidine-5'-phosphate decarboxylase|nr:orotidine-5-phosphate decarboxylase [Actinomycetota bacterium]